MQHYEKLGVFYLGREYTLDQRRRESTPLLYDSKDLTTHAVCVGMTGSGKTGLCLSLLEEAAIDSIPAIAIDPKGDLGNLLLTFPELSPEEFRPWIDNSAAMRAGQTPEEYAAGIAERWRHGLEEWDQTPERIRKFRESVDLAIYTPGSSAGLPLAILRSFAAPPVKIRNDGDALREQVAAATGGLLGLLGLSIDPLQSREFILISNILQHGWLAGEDLSVEELIRRIQSPPFDRVGVADLETFFPTSDRAALAMRLNNLLASPSFGAWLQGEPLDIQSLLYTPEGRPRLSILSIAHLSEAERMFFVTILLNEMVAWTRNQSGTSSLRAILYMDEVFGYIPPVANPPSKGPLLTLLKQARAYGVGIVLATQNPADLDYKGLSNTGTWFLGRLQTERDKARVLEGLEGASLQAGQTFDRKTMEATLASLGSRVFLMNNVHEDMPVVFESRWALSYLRGPLTKDQIGVLMAERKAALGDQNSVLAADASGERIGGIETEQRPVLPAGIHEDFLDSADVRRALATVVYRPALLGRARMHYVDRTLDVDTWMSRDFIVEIRQQVGQDPWDAATLVDETSLQLASEPNGDARFAVLTGELLNPDSYRDWGKLLENFIYRSLSLSVWTSTQLKEHSRPDETEADFRIRLAQQAREQRDLEIEKLRKRNASKFQTLQNRLHAAEQRIAREKSQAQRAGFDAAISIGSALFGALLGRKLTSVTNVSKASSSMRSIGRASQQRGDVQLAEDKYETIEAEIAALNQTIEHEQNAIAAAYEPEALVLDATPISPRKSDLDLQPISLLWLPWVETSDGRLRPAYELKPVE